MTQNSQNSQNSESLAVSGLQKVYFREWDNAQESIDRLEEKPTGCCHEEALRHNFRFNVCDVSKR